MSKNNLVIGIMFIILGLSLAFRHVVAVDFRVMGIVIWSIFVLRMGVKAFKKSYFSMSSCIMIAIATGLFLDQIPQLDKISSGTFIKPLFLLAIGLSFAFGKKEFVSKKKSNSSHSLKT